MTFIFEIDLNITILYPYAKYLSQRSLNSNVIVWTHEYAKTGKHTT